MVPPDINGNEKVQPTPNITQAPEEAHRRTCGKAKEYPPVVWRRDADGKMERVSLSVICQEYKKLNRDMFALTFWSTGNIKRSGDMALMSLTLDKTIPTVADLLASPLVK